MVVVADGEFLAFVHNGKEVAVSVEWVHGFVDGDASEISAYFDVVELGDASVHEMYMLVEGLFKIWLFW
jgi:hypothetical protein